MSAHYAEDEWVANGDGVVETTCDRCGKARPCLLVDDPFIAEVYPERATEREWWCGPCHAARKDDI